jgi:hypothetical protein
MEEDSPPRPEGYAGARTGLHGWPNQALATT